MKRLIWLTIISIVPYHLPVHAAEIGEPSLSKEASEILTRMTDFIAAAPAFTIVADIGNEILQTNGNVLEFGSHFEAAIQRPSQAIGRIDSRDGSSATIILDGEAISTYTIIEEQYFYDTTRQPGDIHTTLNFLAKQLKVPRQLSHIFSKDLTASWSDRVKSGYYVGESIIGGVLCDHLALRGEEIDAQLWIAQGSEPAPRRVIYTYRNVEGRPQFWVQFTEWDFSPNFSDIIFEFSPPEDAERFRFFEDMAAEESD